MQRSNTADQEQSPHWNHHLERQNARILGPLLILLAAALATAPLLVRGCSCGHDFDFHLVSWFDALASWRHGILYPHWATSPNYGAGEPRFIFYPPLTWMLGAALGAVMPWSWVPAAMTFLLLAGTGLATRALARLALSEGASTLAGGIAIFSGYTLYTAYERSAFAELAGGIWIPLLLLMVLRETSRRFDLSAVGLALIIAAAWLSNAPVGVMCCYLLAAIAVAVAALRRSWISIVRAITGATLGLGLAAFYLVPAAVEQKWVQIRQATDDPGEQIQNSFLFGHHADPQLALHDAELHRVSWIAVGMLAVILIVILIAWCRRTLPGDGRWWIPLALIPLAVLLLQLPISLPVWNLLPKLPFLQFPWRWLVVVEVPLGIFAASALWTRNRTPRRIAAAACTLIFIAFTVYAGRQYFQVCDDEDAIAPMLAQYRSGNGFQGTDEYAPIAADNSLVAENLPAACLVANPNQKLGVISSDDPQPQWAADQKSCLAALSRTGTNPQHWAARGSLPQAGFLVLRLRAYPAWEVRVNGQPFTATGHRQDGLMAIPVAAGPVEVEADWRTTPDVRAGCWISLATFSLITALCVIERRRKSSQIK